MRKIKVIMAALAISGLISGCSGEARQEVTKICPVTDWITVDNGVVATFDMDGVVRDFEFLDKYIYKCDESSRVIGVGTQSNSWMSLRMYLYLSEEDYDKYTDNRFGIFEGTVTVVETKADEDAE